MEENKTEDKFDAEQQKQNEEVDFESFLFNVKSFVEKKIAYYQLDAIDKVTRETSAIATIGILGVLALGCFIFICFCLGFILSEVFESLAMGFGIVAVFFISLTLLVFVFRKELIQRPIADLFIKQLFKEEEDEKNG